MPPVFPGIAPYRSALELILPVALVAVALAPLRWILVGLGFLAAAQVVLLVVLAALELAHTSPTFTARSHPHGIGSAAAGVALLFLCASLPLYLGKEVSGGGRTIRRGLVLAVAVVGAAFLAAAIPLAAVPAALRDAAVPGAAIAAAYGGRRLEIAVGLLTAAGTLALIVAEYLALARLVHWLYGPPIRTVLRWIAVPFVAADAISLVDPEGFYADLLKPSLAALFISQAVVFLVFPRLQRSPAAIAAVAVATGLVAWGLHTVIAGGSGSST